MWWWFGSDDERKRKQDKLIWKNYRQVIMQRIKERYKDFVDMYCDVKNGNFMSPKILTMAFKEHVKDMITTVHGDLSRRYAIFEENATHKDYNELLESAYQDIIKRINSDIIIGIKLTSWPVYASPSY